MGKIVKTLINKGKTGFDAKLIFSNGDVLNLYDVDCSKESVERLLSRLQGEEIDEDQLPYVVQDHLVREYTVPH